VFDLGYYLGMEKKNFERYVLDQFLLNKEIKLSISSIEEGETPDFVLRDKSERVISVELSQIIKKEIKKKEAFHEKIVSQAQKLFREKYGDSVIAHITFSSKIISCKYSETYIYANEIFRIAEKLYLPHKNSEFHISSRSDTILPDFMEHIMLDNQDIFTKWQPFGGFLVNKIDSNWLASIISEKQKNISDYKEVFDENWLLLISHLGNESSGVHFENVRINTMTIFFEHVYIYQYMKNEIVVIK
jgi:hypothetical protein